MAIVAALALFTVPSARSADRSGNVATYRNDPEHKSDGERCLQILTEAGMKPATVDGFFAVVTVAPADTERAQHLIADAIEHGGLHVRLTHSPPAPDSYFETVAWYYDKDKSDSDRAYAVLREHEIEAEGVGMSGTASISVMPKEAAEARRILSQIIKAENLRVNVKPAEEQSESPGALFFVRHLTIPADQSPEGREITRLIIVKNIEVEPLTFTSEKVWSGELPEAVTTAWSPDARFLVFAGTPAGESTRLFCVDLSAAHPQTTELNLGEAAQAAEAKRVENLVPGRQLKFSADLKSMVWSAPGVGRLQLLHGTGDQMQTDVLKVDLDSSPPGLSIE